MSVLPTPVSPRTRIGMSLGAAIASRLSMACIGSFSDDGSPGGIDAERADAAASSWRSRTTITTEPSSTTSPASNDWVTPCERSRPRTRTPLTLPRSRTVYGRVTAISACSRDTDGWSTISSHRFERPIRTERPRGTHALAVPPSQTARTRTWFARESPNASGRVASSFGDRGPTIGPQSSLFGARLPRRRARWQAERRP